MDVFFFFENGSLMIQPLQRSYKFHYSVVPKKLPEVTLNPHSPPSELFPTCGTELNTRSGLALSQIRCPPLHCMILVGGFMSSMQMGHSGQGIGLAVGQVWIVTSRASNLAAVVALRLARSSLRASTLSSIWDTCCHSPIAS